MINDALRACLADEGVVSITTWADGDAHVSNTWNSYLEILGNTLLVPAGWLHTTERNITKNNALILTFGSKTVQGKIGMGTGFVVHGSATFLSEGELFDRMKERFSFVTRVMVIEMKKVRQTL